jgi:trehalose 6-phosphate phosphatase
MLPAQAPQTGMATSAAMLPESRTEAGAAGLAAIIAEPARAIIATDYDGTLAPIVERPEDAVAAPGAIAALAALGTKVGEVAIITGRPVRDVLRLSGIAGQRGPGGLGGFGRLIILGQYGLERWDARSGRIEAPAPLPGVDVVRRALPDLVKTAPDGTTIEDKGHALVVHVRRTSDPDGALDMLRAPLTALAERNGLELAAGRRVLELRPPGHTKDVALTGLVAERSAGSVLFAGDDVGDLPAFDAVERLRQSGVPGVAVCSDSAEVGVVRERADIVVDGPTGVAAFLVALGATIGD